MLCFKVINIKLKNVNNLTEQYANKLVRLRANEQIAISAMLNAYIGPT